MPLRAAHPERAATGRRPPRDLGDQRPPAPGGPTDAGVSVPASHHRSRRRLWRAPESSRAGRYAATSADPPDPEGEGAKAVATGASPTAYGRVRCRWAALRCALRQVGVGAAAPRLESKDNPDDVGEAPCPPSPSVIVAGARTPMGRLLGSLKGFSGSDLGGIAIKGALEKAGVRRRPGRLRDHGPGPHGRRRPDPRPPGRGQGAASR